MGINQPKIFLTKVLYYDGDHQSLNRIRTISEALDIHKPMRQKPGVIIKRNIFGHKWVLKLNESSNSTKNKSFTKLAMYIIVFTAIVLAFLFGLLIFFGSKFLESNQREFMFKTVPNKNITINFNKTNSVYSSVNVTRLNLSDGRNFDISKNKTTNTVMNSTHIETPCSKCANDFEICFQELRNPLPECRQIVDKTDPTGCGGICKLETQYCKRLVRDLNIFSCVDIETFTCQDTEWKCQNTALCIPKRKKCDGIIHCYDKSDEINCVCDMTENFYCGQNISCISNNKKCDGTVDCWDASDELNCSQMCDKSRLPCSSGQCIEKAHFCDGKYDCLDKSDEPDGCRSTL